MTIDWRENEAFRARCRIWEADRLALRSEVDFLIGLDLICRQGGIMAVEQPAAEVADPVCRRLLEMYAGCVPERKVARFAYEALMDPQIRGAQLLRRFLYAEWVRLELGVPKREELTAALEGCLADSSQDIEPLGAEEIAILEAPLDFGGEADDAGKGEKHD